jgi:quercetin dioxygenase-like cupin family protein
MVTALITEADASCTESTVDVLDGVVYVATLDDEWILTPGDTAHIAAGTPYHRWDAGDDEARWVEVHCAG